MTEDPDYIDRESAKFARALLLAEASGDRETVELIRRTASDHWCMLRWAVGVIEGCVLEAGRDPVEFARQLIDQAVADEADGP